MQSSSTGRVSYILLIFLMSVWLAQLVKAPTLSQRVCVFIREWPCRGSEVQLPGQTAQTQASILSRSVNE